jgi:hypothetical protein
MPPSSTGGDDDLSKGLSKAKTAKADNPMFFLLVLKGSEGVLVVDRKKITTAQIAAAKKRSGGTTLVKGVCYGEDGRLIFETPEKPAPAWSVAARKSAKDHASQTISPVFRLGRDPDTLPDALDEEETEETTPAPTVKPEGKVAGAERYLKLKTAVTPALAKLKAANPKAAAVIQGVLDKAQGFADNQDFAKATALVEQAVKAVTQALATTPPKTTSEVPTGKVALEVLRNELRTVRMQAIRGVTELITKLRASGAPQSKEIAEVIKKLATAMPAELETILQQLDTAVKANDSATATKMHGEVQRTAKGWMDFLKVNAKTIEGCEKNPWKVNVRIADPVRNSLKSILAAAR